MKTENIDEALDLLIEYHTLSRLREKTKETIDTITELSDKMNQSTSDAEIAHCQIEIVMNIQGLISHGDLNRYNFKYDVLRYGLLTAITKLDLKLKELKDKIEEL